MAAGQLWYVWQHLGERILQSEESKQEGRLEGPHSKVMVWLGRLWLWLCGSVLFDTAPRVQAWGWALWAHSGGCPTGLPAARVLAESTRARKETVPASGEGWKHSGAD